MWTGNHGQRSSSLRRLIIAGVAGAVVWLIISLMTPPRINWDQAPVRPLRPRPVSPKPIQRSFPTAAVLPPSVPANPLAGKEDWVPNPRLPVYELNLNSQDLTALVRHPFSNQTYPAAFKAGATNYNGVRVRDRGNTLRGFPKKSFKILFDHGQLFENQREINLNSCWHDPAYIRETFSYYIYAQCGLLTPKSRLVQLLVNGQFYGLYEEVEQPDKAFIARVKLPGVVIYKAIDKAMGPGFGRLRYADERELSTTNDYAKFYTLETRKAAGFQELQGFISSLARATNLLDFFTQHLDLESYISYLAGGVLIQNWNCSDKNHLLAYDARGSHRWFVVPWDLDRTLGDHWRGGYNTTQMPILLGSRQFSQDGRWNRMADRFFSEPVLLARFLDRLEQLTRQVFDPEKLFPVLDQLEAQISSTAAQDRRLWPSPRDGYQGFYNLNNPEVRPTDLHQEIAAIKNYIERRRTFLLNEIPKLRNRDKPGTPSRS